MYIVIPRYDEEFKDITYPNVRQGKYLISNYGRIYSKIQNKFLKTSITRDGYVLGYLRSENNTKLDITVHRLVAWEFCDGYDEKHIFVNHIDSCRTNNYFENLEWVTAQDNTIHGFIHGNNNKYGENAPTNKYPKSMIYEIRNMIDKGMRDIEIMNYYGYEKTRDNLSLRDLIYSIRHNLTWKHI